MVNPEPEQEAGQDAAPKKKEKNVFRVGDRIIHNRNKNGISNGDIGFVTDIFTDEDDMELTRLEFLMTGMWSITATSWIWWSILMQPPYIRARAVNIR